MKERLLDASFKLLLKRTGKISPKAVFVLGTGWQMPLENFKIRLKMEYGKISALGKTTMAGHKGELLIIEANGIYFLIFSGRRHFYETASWEPVAFPVYVAKRLNTPYLVLTNSAGGISKAIKPGSFMLIRDHINAFWHNPLLGEKNIFRGNSFIDQTAIYDEQLRKQVLKEAKREKIKLNEGIYLATIGGCYETPAEVRAFRRLGADAVGSSTVPEAILAAACGIKVIAISFITNYAAGIAKKALKHEEIKRFCDVNAANIATLLKIVLKVVR